MGDVFLQCVTKSGGASDGGAAAFHGDGNKVRTQGYCSIPYTVEGQRWSSRMYEYRIGQEADEEVCD